MSILKNTSVYALVGIANAAVPFALLPVMTRYLGPEDYGLVAIYQSLAGFAVAVTGLSVHGAVSRQWFERERIDFPAYVGGCLLILLVSTAAAAVITTLAGPALGAALSFPVDWLWVIWATSAVQFVGLVFLTLLQCAERPGGYGAFQLSSTVLNLSLSVVLVVGFGWSWKGRIWANLLVLTASGALALVAMRRMGWLAWRFDRAGVRNALAFGIPLVPHAFFGWSLANLDRILAAGTVSVADAGLMLAGWQLAMAVGIVEDSYNRAWAPWFMAQMKEGGELARMRIVVMTWRYMAGLLLFAVLVGLAAPLVAGWLLGPRFARAGDLTAWYCLAAALGGCYKMMANYLFWRERTGFVLLCSGIAAAVHVAACIIGLRWHGALGAVLGSVAAQGVLFLATAWCANRVQPMPWRAGLMAVFARRLPAPPPC